MASRGNASTAKPTAPRGNASAANRATHTKQTTGMDTLAKQLVTTADYEREGGARLRPAGVIIQGGLDCSRHGSLAPALLLSFTVNNKLPKASLHTFVMQPTGQR
jgi:hypothetical protein